MTSQGTPAGRFRRAITARSVLNVELALAEMEHVQIKDALQLVYLYAEAGDPKYAAAARKYLARWIVEARPWLEDVAATACSFVEHS